MNYKTTCSYCGVGCGIIVDRDAKGKLSIVGDTDHPANKGMLCSKGRNLNYVVQDVSDRLLYPMTRMSRNHSLQRTSWNKAIYKASKVFQTFIKKYGPESVGFYVSGQCLTEEYYLVNKLCKGYIGTNNIDTNSRLCMSSAVVGYKKTFGEDSVPVSYDDIELADCFYITGANPAWCHPIIFRRLEKHKQNNPEIKIIIADPRKTASCEIADIHLQINPGSDIHLNHAISKYLIENRMIDQNFIDKHTYGFDKLKKDLSGMNMDNLSDICGVSSSEIIQAARIIGKSKGLITMWAMGLNQSIHGVDKNLSLLNISLLTGKIGKPGSGPFSLTGQPNAMGGREVGGMSNLLPAHRDLFNEHHRNEVAKFWNVKDIPSKPGLTATEMFEKLHTDKLKAIWIICTNPLVSLPNVKMVEEALQKARFVIVQDISTNSITADYADIVLPAAGWLEKEGTMTNSDRRISYLPAVVDAPGEAKPDSEIIMYFARQMGYKGFEFNNSEEIFNEHKELTRGTNIDISGLSYNYLKSKGSAQWPFSEKSGQETKRLFIDFKFYTENKKANLHSVKLPEYNLPPESAPLILITGRIRDQWHTMTRTGKVQKLNKHIEAPFIEIHSDDALIRKIVEDDIVEIRSEYGTVRVIAKVTKEIKKGVVFLPMHWGKIFKNDYGRANNLTTGKVDPVSKQPDFKYTHVEVTKFIKQDETIILVGAGAAAYKFIESYREKNISDRIIVFSAEKEPFYNRILLPEYLNGERSFEDLRKMRFKEIDNFHIELHNNNRIIDINSELKEVTDSYGIIHSYDRLILCTGSSSHIPPHIDRYLPGIFSLRNKEDADDIINKINIEDVQNILVVGGGLLGLETASALIHLKKHTTIVHRNSRLMDKQLDYISASLLSEQIINLGIEVRFNDEVENIIERNETKLMVIFKSGKKRIFDAVIFAVGTKPNISIARNAGLKINYAVIINERLETSKENIYAIGEIAELNGQTWGITSAAEEQAVILANSILGNPNAVYQGSVSMNILKFPGIELSSLGTIKVPEDKKSEYEEIIFSDMSMYYYKKCILKNDRLVGAILLGDKLEFSSFKALIQGKQELAELRKKLLRSGNSVPPIKGKIVCSCNNIGKGNIEDQINTGIKDLKTLTERTGAGTGCGSCVPEVKQILSLFNHQETTSG